MGQGASNPVGKVQIQDFYCAIGDDFYVPMSIVNTLTGAPEDVSLWSFFMEIFESWEAKQADDEALITLSNGNGFTIISGPLGKVDLAINSQQTALPDLPLTAPYGADIPQNSCVYDMVVVDGNGLTRTRARGNFVFQLRLSVT